MTNVTERPPEVDGWKADAFEATRQALASRQPYNANRTVIPMFVQC